MSDRPEDMSPAERGRGLQRPMRAFDQLEQRIANAGRFGLPLTIDPLGTFRPCPHCGEQRQLRATTPNQIGRSIRYWSDCACVVAQVARAAAVSQRAADAIRGTRGDENDGGAYDMQALSDASALTLDTYRPDWMVDRTPYDAAAKWLNDIRLAQVVCGYRVGPPAALYFHGPRGRGKTHLAIALLLLARDEGHRVAILNEMKYLHQTRSIEFGAPFESLVAEPGERAWLTLIDDIGKYKPTSKDDRLRVQNAWLGVLDRRYNRRRWTLFTSEKNLDELLRDGTIDGALYSRMYEMTRGVCLPFTGADQRLRGQP
jgi:hypothetical protein